MLLIIGSLHLNYISDFVAVFCPSGNYIFLQKKLCNRYMLNIINRFYKSLKMVKEQ